jgi:DnaJ-class molecular chaperone
VSAETLRSVEAGESFDVVRAAEVLGVSPFVDRRGLRACYRRLLLEHHPDRHAGGTAQLVQEGRTREIVEAFNVLDARISAAEDRFRASRALAEDVRLGGLRRGPGRVRSATELLGYISMTIGLLTVAYAVVPL